MGMIKLTPAPQWLIKECGRAPEPKEKPSREMPPGIDPDYAEARAIDYLKHHAPEAVEGERDDTAYRIACRLRDFGVDEPTAHALMLDYWDKCYPMLENLEHPVASAYKYAQSAPGNSAPELEFEPIPGAEKDDPFEPKPTYTPLVIQRVEPFESAAIPRREWLVGKLLIAQKVTIEIAMPGAGKSTHALQTSLAFVTGRDDICGEHVHKRGVATIINNEDDADEMRRRLAAVMQHFNVSWGDIKDRLYLYSGVERPFIIAGRRSDGSIHPIDKDALIAHIRATGTKLLVVDPFLETHHVSENANEEINQVARMYREIAATTGTSVLLIHHTRKLPTGGSDGHVGNMESGRGASSLGGVARVVATLYGMSEKDATKYGVPKDRRHHFVRLDDAKANLSLIDPRPKWFERVDVGLTNGDHVGVLSPVELREVEEVHDNLTLEIIREVIESAPHHEATLSRVASAVADADLSGKGESRQTAMRRVRSVLANRVAANGWELWLEEDEQRDKKTKFWVYGRMLDGGNATDEAADSDG